MKCKKGSLTENLAILTPNMLSQSKETLAGAFQLRKAQRKRAKLIKMMAVTVKLLEGLFQTKALQVPLSVLRSLMQMKMNNLKQQLSNRLWASS